MPPEGDRSELRFVAMPSTGLPGSAGDIDFLDRKAAARELEDAQSTAREVARRLSRNSEHDAPLALLKFASACEQPIQEAGFDSIPAEGWVSAVKREATKRGEVPVCVIHLRPVQSSELPPSSDVPTKRFNESEQQVWRPLSSAEAVSRIRKLIDELDDQRLGYNIALDGKSWVFNTLQIAADPEVVVDGDVRLLSPVKLDRLVPRLLEFVDHRDFDLIVLLTSFPKSWDGRRMPDPTAAMRAAATRLFEAAETASLADGPNLSNASANGAARLLRLQGAWECARAEAKSHLEETIQEQAKRPLATFEEKRDLASMLMQSMDRWGFRAKSPHTGNPSILRVRQAKGAEAGTFQFDELPGADQDVPASRRVSRGASPQLPVFELTDRPPDRRRREP